MKKQELKDLVEALEQRFEVTSHSKSEIMINLSEGFDIEISLPTTKCKWFDIAVWFEGYIVKTMQVVSIEQLLEVLETTEGFHKKDILKLFMFGNNVGLITPRKNAAFNSKRGN